MATKVVKPVVLDETMQRAVEKLGEIKTILDNKMFTPSVVIDEKEITTNGTYEATTENADGYAKVIVNVEGGGTLDVLEVDENGTYLPSDYDLDGFSKVIVDVPTGGGIDFESLMAKNVAQATVPTSWEIPTTITVIPAPTDENYYSWRNSLFDDMNKLQTVTLAAGHTGITEIGANGFAYFANLGDVAFADGAMVGSYGFASIGITSIPSTLHLNIVGNSCFYYCPNLASIDMTNISITNESTNTFWNCTSLTTATNIALANGGVLPSGTFQYTAVKEPTFKETVKYLGSDCFNGMTVGGDGVFRDTEGKITNENYKVNEMIPYYRLTDWGGQLFFYSTTQGYRSGGSDIYFEEKPTLFNNDMSPFVDDPDGWHLVYRETIEHTGEKWCLDYGTSPGDLQCYDPEVVTSPDNNQFAGGYDITGFYLPNLKNIGTYMFGGNQYVTEFDFPEATRIASQAFTSCSMVTTILIPKCEYFYSDDIIEGDEALEKIDLSGVDSVTETSSISGMRITDNKIKIKVKSSMVAAFQSSDWANLNMDGGGVEFVTSW